MSIEEKNDWFRNKTWSETIESDFLTRLGNTPRALAMACLKVQGDQWLSGRDETTQRAGVKLLEKLISDYAEEVYDITAAQGILGDYYYQRADFDRAKPYLNAVLRFYKEFKRTGVNRTADLMLAEIILLCNDTDRLAEAWQLVIDFPTAGGSISEEHEQHRYYELLAQLSYRLDRKAEAANYAAKALTLAKNMELDFLIGKPAALEKLYTVLPSLEAIAGSLK
jgi:tetratricopeptide (TPR) repeat protein